MKTRILIEVEIDDMKDAIRDLNLSFGERLTRLSIEEVKPIEAKAVTYSVPKTHGRDKVQWTNE